MTSKRFTILSGIALLGGAAIFGIPNSVWWDGGSILPRILVGLGVASWAYVVYDVAKNLDPKNPT